MEIATLLALAKDYPWVWVAIILYGALSIYVKVSSAPTKKEGWENVLKEIAQRVSVTDFKGGKAFTLPGAGSGTPTDGHS